MLLGKVRGMDIFRCFISIYIKINKIKNFFISAAFKIITKNNLIVKNFFLNETISFFQGLLDKFCIQIISYSKKHFFEKLHMIKNVIH